VYLLLASVNYYKSELMKNKLLPVLGIALLFCGTVACIGFVSVFIDEPKSAVNVITLILTLGIFSFLPLFFGYRFVKNYSKMPSLKNAFTLKGSMEGLDQLPRYFKQPVLEIPKGKWVSAAGKDEKVIINDNKERQKSLNNAFYIEYKDVNGLPSKRRITVYNILPIGSNDFYLESFCHEKNSDRTFKLSRIEEMIELDSGEVIEDKLSFFYEKYCQMSENPVLTLLGEKHSEALVLIFIARADGVLRRKELEATASYLMNRCSYKVEKEDLIKELKKKHCLIHEFKKHIRIINESTTREKKEELLQCINEVIFADKKADDLELAGLETIRKIFGIASASTVAA
jgi:uncharacterized tellurite resistance protein B-like protein